MNSLAEVVSGINSGNYTLKTVKESAERASCEHGEISSVRSVSVIKKKTTKSKSKSIAGCCDCVSRMCSQEKALNGQVTNEVTQSKAEHTHPKSQKSNLICMRSAMSIIKRSSSSAAAADNCRARKRGNADQKVTSTDH